jgi:hypothetical protein
MTGPEHPGNQDWVIFTSSMPASIRLAVPESFASTRMRIDWPA